jgi:hypothetical protein
MCGKEESNGSRSTSSVHSRSRTSSCLPARTEGQRHYAPDMRHAPQRALLGNAVTCGHCVSRARHTADALVWSDMSNHDEEFSLQPL